MAATVKKNDHLQVHIVDLTHDGAGVAKVEGYPLFIPGTLPGEKVEVRVVKTLKKYGYGKLIKIIEPSMDRVKPSCDVFPRCGGCQVQHLSYEGQLKWKQKLVQETMARIGKLADVPVHPVKGMKDPWCYRNKSQIPFAEEKGKVVAGFFRPGSHKIVDTDQCLIQTPEADALLSGLKQGLQEIGIRPYDEEKDQGMLRHLIVRKGMNTGETMVILVTRYRNFPQKKEAVQWIRKVLPGVDSIVQNVNDRRTNVILGNETILLYGSPVIRERIGNITYEISPRSFFQINSEQTEVLYNQVLEYADLTGEETVVDAYCGIGSISLFLAQEAKEVYGVEIVPEAIADAKRNAQRNGITNAQFEVGAAEEVLPRWYQEGKRFDVIVVDPPRKGCDKELLKTIIQYPAKRLIYVSCNPATLARDLRILEDGGYKTQEIQPVDLFPQSSPVECVVLLSWVEE